MLKYRPITPHSKGTHHGTPANRRTQPIRRAAPAPPCRGHRFGHHQQPSRHRSQRLGLLHWWPDAYLMADIENPIQPRYQAQLDRWVLKFVYHH